MRLVKKHRDHSKIITDAALIGAAVILVYAMVMIAVTRDMSSLPELIGVAAAIVTAAIGFYMWRAKAKDKLEMRREYGPEIYNDAGIADDE